MEAVIVAIPVLFVLSILIGAFVWRRHVRRKLDEGYARLLARDGLHPTDRPCGLDRRQLVDRFDATPRGARRYGLRYAAQGTVDLPLAGYPVRVELACFQWWYEVRTQNDRSSSYQEHTTTVAAVRLPIAVPGTIRLKPEGVLGRVGLRRGDQQLESEEFNRRFHVRGSDPQLTVRFLDAAMQHRLLSTATGRSIHLERDLLVLGGSPAHRDASLPGVIGELPAAAQDAIGLLGAVPAQVWRTAAPTGRPGAPTTPPPAAGGAA